jgi:hypothetical protein
MLPILDKVKYDSEIHAYRWNLGHALEFGKDPAWAAKRIDHFQYCKDNNIAGCK